MQPSDLYVVHCSIEKDMVSRYIESFQLIPKAFGHQLNNPAATCRERIIGDMELIYYAGGCGLVTIDSVLYECHAGDLLLIPSYVPHSISTPPDDPHDNYWLHFDFPQLYRQQVGTPPCAQRLLSHQPWHSAGSSLNLYSHGTG